MTDLLSEQLEHEFPVQLRDAGAALFAAAKVVLLEREDGFLLAEVHDMTEILDVALRWSADQVRTEAACTCERFEDQGYCPHLWAAILAHEAAGGDGAARTKSGKAGSALPNAKRAAIVDPLDWRARLADLRPARSRRLRDPWKDVPTGSRRIVYVVGFQKSLNDTSLVLNIFQERRLKSGRFGSRKPWDGETDESVGGLGALDRQILGLLLWQPWPMGGADERTGVHPLNHAQVETLLPLLCRTERLFLEGPKQKGQKPLAFDSGSPWELAFELVRDEEIDECRIDGQLVREHERMSLTEPLLFLGSGWFFTSERIARFEAHGALSWLEALRRSGPIRATLDDESLLAQALLDQPGAPLVRAAGLRWMGAIAPKPHLWVSKRGGDDGRLDAIVSFDYGGVRVRSSDDLRAVRAPTEEGAIGALVHRDRELEREHLAAFARLGGTEVREPTVKRDAAIAAERLGELVRALVDCGWTVDAEGVRWRRAGKLKISVRSNIDWFDLSGGLDFEGETASLPALLEAARTRSRTVRLGDGSLGILPEKWLEQWELFDQLGLDAGDSLRFDKSQAFLLDALLAEREGVEHDEGFAELGKRVARFRGVEAQQEPEGFIGQLRSYQREGLGWFHFLRELGFGGCLADDMGLGKTVQVLALLAGRALEERKVRPSLVVAPRSLCFHWRREAERFAPNLRVIEYTGTDRRRLLRTLDEYDLVITTYGTLRQDAEQLSARRFDYVVLDEAQAIKNAASQSAKAARLLQAEQRLALSGTPIENHLGELWSLFEFLNPGMLGRAGVLREHDLRTAQPFEDENSRKLLARALRPFFLRRTKLAVLPELPKKVEQVLHVTLEGAQLREYEELRKHYQMRLLASAAGEAEPGTVHVLEALLRLRQAACHPGLIDPARVGESSPKLEALLLHLDEVAESGHKALVFSQFTSMLAIVRSNLEARGMVYEYLDGSTQDREERINRFQQDEACPVFLISLKAGGFGLNLTAADYVFLLDPWWNPAAESQAIDRAHRIGQLRNVMAYRLIARGTVEERVLELQDRKRGLADALLGGTENADARLTREDLELLLS